MSIETSRSTQNVLVCTPSTPCTLTFTLPSPFFGRSVRDRVILPGQSLVAIPMWPRFRAVLDNLLNTFAPGGIVMVVVEPGEDQKLHICFNPNIVTGADIMEHLAKTMTRELSTPVTWRFV